MSKECCIINDEIKMTDAKIAKRWVVADKKSADVIEQILINRGINKKDWERFLNPSFESLADPAKIKNMARAAKRIIKAIADKTAIGIFGDYDADGIPAAALLHQAVERLGGQSIVYIPTRERGYGVTKEGLDFLISNGCQLIITVDTGITAKAEVEYAGKKGVDVIVVDHHIVQAQKAPKAFAVVNPKQPGDKSSFKDYAACGLAYQLVRALAKLTGKISTLQLKWWLDLPVISTVGDMVPLVGENRVITKYGLLVLQNTNRAGLRKLYEKAHIDPKMISASSVSFQIAPRINSAGRMEIPGLPIDYISPALVLLTTHNTELADDIAGKLERINRERQEVLEQAIAQAKAKVEKEKLHRHKLILVTDSNWPAGVVGLVAGKLMESYARPVIVLRQEEGIARGSARSIEAFNIMSALDHVKKYLLKHGGHPRAAGLSLELKHLDLVYDKLVTLAGRKLSDQDITPKISIDSELSLKQINLQFYNRLRSLEPHGVGNPKPLFLFKNLLVNSAKAVGSDAKHLRMRFTQGSIAIGAIGFDLANHSAKVKSGDIIDAVGFVDQNKWNGNSEFQLKVVDIKVN